jgi:hypothetical protein
MGKTEDQKKIAAFTAGAIIGGMVDGPPGALVGGFLALLLDEASKRRW